MKTFALTVSLLSLLPASGALAQETAARATESVARTLVPLENDTAARAAGTAGETLPLPALDAPVAEDALPAGPVAQVEASPMSPMIRHQLQASDDMLRMRREGERMQAAADLAKVVGIDNLSRIMPDLGIDLENSPLALQAQIDEMQLINDLTQALVDNRQILMESATADEATPPVAAPGPDEGQLAVNGENLRPVTMGELQELLARRDVSAPLYPDPASAPVLPAGEAIPVPEEGQAFEMQVVQVYGSNEDYTAIVLLNGQETKMRSGDSLPDGSTVLAVARDSVTIAGTDGTEQVLNLR